MQQRLVRQFYPVASFKNLRSFHGHGDDAGLRSGIHNALTWVAFYLGDLGEASRHARESAKHVGLNTRLEVALEELESESLVEANIVDALKLLSRMLVMMRLVAPGDVKPTAETWQLVAEASGAASWDELLAEHDAARQRIAALWTSIKQGA